ncbi:MAG: S1C family serine protease [candidate division KSB1 bacterium]|nr:S1C family serine protease [candidate division KSB1 bacterium]MDZ7301456.1 S1C family serine protease [candidate division KSB1 bacterium]
MLLGLLPNGVFAQDLLLALESEMRQLVEIAKPSVVTILAATSKGKNDGSGLFSLFRGREDDTREVKVGSGLIVSSDGFIVTKESVVRDAAQIEIVLVNERVLRAERVMLDSSSGLAVIKAHGEKLVPARIGSMTSVQPGSWVAVIGNALGMPQAVSVGTVSAIHANQFIQISANVDPGSSGSPIFNVQGKAIGIVSGRMGVGSSHKLPENYFSSTCLAHPLALFLPRLREIIRRYYETHGWLGITVMADSKDQQHPKVFSLVKDGPAERAGIQVGDVITHFTNRPITSFTQLPEMVAACRPGARENLTVIRGDSVLNFNVQIGQPAPCALTELQPAPDDDAGNPPDRGNKPLSRENPKFENLQIHQRIQTLEKELQHLRSLRQKR